MKHKLNPFPGLTFVLDICLNMCFEMCFLLKGRLTCFLNYMYKQCIKHVLGSCIAYKLSGKTARVRPPKNWSDAPRPRGELMPVCHCVAKWHHLGRSLMPFCHSVAKWYHQGRSLMPFSHCVAKWHQNAPWRCSKTMPFFCISNNLLSSPCVGFPRITGKWSADHEIIIFS